MNEAPPATRDRLVYAAMTLFAEKGYGSTSVSDILRQAGANSGSLYHAFPTKQDLLLAVLQAYKGGIEPMLLEPAWGAVADPVEKVFALLDCYRNHLASSDCTYGCPIGSLALELHEPDPPVRQLLADNFEGWRGHVEACFEQARGRFRPGFDPRRAASFTLTVMEGAVMQARTYRSLEAFDEAVASLREYLDAMTIDNPNPETS
jgi:AcrR family transcriptional regulator